MPLHIHFGSEQLQGQRNVTENGVDVCRCSVSKRCGRVRRGALGEWDLFADMNLATLKIHLDVPTLHHRQNLRYGSAESSNKIFSFLQQLRTHLARPAMPSVASLQCAVQQGQRPRPHGSTEGILHLPVVLHVIRTHLEPASLTNLQPLSTRLLVLNQFRNHQTFLAPQQARHPAARIHLTDGFRGQAQECSVHHSQVVVHAKSVLQLSCGLFIRPRIVVAFVD
mmetsp:Transcript_35927/g.86495  ORF Transcript_35927/g.86495 Transcript_35927/m.86495 type:complete len:224 (+) Transcript_35927:219-890(+)